MVYAAIMRHNLPVNKNPQRISWAERPIPDSRQNFGAATPRSSQVTCSDDDFKKEKASFYGFRFLILDRQKLAYAHDDDPGRIGVGGLRGLGQR
jgi:hypothetical protein